jgi:hypothetical protein
MSLLLYGFAQCEPDAVKPSTGVASQPVVAIGDRGLVALVSEHDAPPGVTEATLWSYEQVLEEQMSHHPVLPARFGSFFEGAAPIELVLSERGLELEAGFALVNGAVELSVRAISAPAETAVDGRVESGSGRAYLIGRVRRSQDARRLAGVLGARLNVLARASRYQTLTAPDILVSAAYLVERGRIDDFTGRISDLQAEVDPVDLTCTGPWPPFSFSDASGDG